MKKLTTLLFVLVFASSMAFAQSNSASVTQEVDDSESIINQNGSSNSADTYQILGNGNMLINIDQQSNKNKADVTQRHGQYHEAQIDQSGSKNEAYLTQDNTSTLTDISQDGNKNLADVYQRNYDFAFEDYSSKVDIGQIGDNNAAWVESDGDRNNVSITQGGSNMSSDGQYADVTQAGSDNESTIEQLGRGGADHTQIQDGSGNDAVAESSWGSSSGLQEQYGSDNTSIFKQNGSHSATTIQDGMNNYSWLRQGAGSSTASLEQYGDENQVNADQRGEGNMMTVEQDGLNNTAGTQGFSNRGLFQYGDNNSLQLSQLSDGNSAYVNQNGNMNQANITQN